MPQLMECPPVGALTEQLGGATVRQSGSTGDWTAVDAWYRSRRLTIRPEHGAGRAPSQQSREQKGGARLPEGALAQRDIIASPQRDKLVARQRPCAIDG